MALQPAACRLYTPFPVPEPTPEGLIQGKPDAKALMLKYVTIALNAVGKVGGAFNKVVGYGGKKFLAGLDIMLCGHFKDGLALFTQVSAHA